MASAYLNIESHNRTGETPLFTAELYGQLSSQERMRQAYLA
jgi:hypothetical protein